MGASAGPDIVDTGLVLALDAADRNSYPGSGTTWTDLSGRGNTGTLTNGPTYSSANGGSLVFDGVDDYVRVPSTNGLYLADTSQVSVSCWGRTNNVNTQFQNFVMWEDQVDVNNVEPIRLTINGTAASNSSFNPRFDLVNNSGISTNLIGISTVVDSTYYNLVGTTDGTTAKLYINGILNNQVSFSGNFKTPVSGTSARWIIGRGEISNSDRLLNGNIAQVSIYNRALTAAEVQQNFNATRGRFGI
jgi:hypothetical protein